MLRIEILGEEQWDSENDVFLYPDKFVVKLEHSLVALSKWESKFEKPFLTEEEKTDEEVMAYVECMILGLEDPSLVIPLLTQDNLKQIQQYIDSKQTATWFTETPKKRSSQTITNELVYFWMSQAGVPMECQYWHLNRLFTLLRVHSAHNSNAANGGKKKFTSDEVAKRAAENRRRREMYGSKG